MTRREWLAVVATSPFARRSAAGTAIRRRPRLYAGLAASWVVVGAIVASGPRWRSAGLSSGVSPWLYLLNQPELIVIYLRLAVWPIGQVFDYGLPRQQLLASVWPYAAVVLAMLIATAAAWRRHRELAFLGSCFFMALAPTSSIVPIATEVGAERRMYLPLIAIVILCVVGAWWLLTQFSSSFDSRRTRAIGAACLAAAYVALAGFTVQRNSEYRSRTGIWQTVLDRYLKKYDTRAKMGTLVFSDIDMNGLSDEDVFVTGAWAITREPDNPHGRFTLLFRRIGNRWRIVYDHSS